MKTIPIHAGSYAQPGIDQSEYNWLVVLKEVNTYQLQEGVLQESKRVEGALIFQKDGGSIIKDRVNGSNIAEVMNKLRRRYHARTKSK